MFKNLEYVLEKQVDCIEFPSIIIPQTIWSFHSHNNTKEHEKHNTRSKEESRQPETG